MLALARLRLHSPVLSHDSSKSGWLACMHNVFSSPGLRDAEHAEKVPTARKLNRALSPLQTWSDVFPSLVSQTTYV